MILLSTSVTLLGILSFQLFLLLLISFKFYGTMVAVWVGKEENYFSLF